MKRLLLSTLFIVASVQVCFADFYVFNHDGKCVSKSSYKPDQSDMDSRGEYAIESNATVELSQARVVNGEVIETPKPAVDLKAEEDAKQEALEHEMFHERMEKIAYFQLKAEGVKFKMHKDSDFDGK